MVQFLKKIKRNWKIITNEIGEMTQIGQVKVTGGLSLVSDDNEQTKQLIIEMDGKMASRSFRFFFESILGFHYSHHHQLWDEGLTQNRYYCVKASRDHGKSTLFMAYALWIAAFKPGTHIMVFSHSLEQTLEHMRFIRNCIDTTPCLRHLRPTGKPWAKS
jgi:reverse gyrase